jgi:enoyl-CoA hydratase
MSTNVTHDGGVAVLRIDEPRGNALSWDTMRAIEGALGELERSDARAAVVTGRGRVFSAGLDLRACSRYDRAELARYVDAFEGLFERVFSFPKPLVAHINGAAIAGGAVVALACDVRVIDAGAAIGLNEVELGIPFPSMAFEVARYAIPASAHVDAIQLGLKFDAGDASERGIVDDVGGEAVAVERARAFLAPGHAAVVATKRALRADALAQRALRADALARARARASESRAAFVDAFLGPEAQARIGALVAKLERK